MAKAQQDFRDDVMFMTSVQSARNKATEIYMNPDLPDRADYIMIGASANPYFVPHLPNELEPASLMTAFGLQRAIALGRASAANTHTVRVLYSAAPHTGSTFVCGMLSKVLNVRRTSLAINSTTPSAQSWFGGATNEQSLDETAILINSMAPGGFIAHNHITCSPMNANILGMYNIKPILTTRNIFDTMVSFDDHILRALPKTNESPLLRHGVPADYARRDFEDRIAVLIDLKLPWYLRYYMSWQACERQEMVRPLWINYERDVLGSKAALARRLQQHLLLHEGLLPVLTEALSEKGDSMLNFNKGVAGRGGAITGANRAKIDNMFARYADEADFSAILD